jgi:hypothetical protein
MVEEERFAMRQRTKEEDTIRENPDEGQCQHYWVIEIANGPKSVGKCKNCGETKEFLNAFPAFNPAKKQDNPLDLPKLPKVKVEKGSKS